MVARTKILTLGFHVDDEVRNLLEGRLDFITGPLATTLTSLLTPLTSPTTRPLSILPCIRCPIVRPPPSGTAMPPKRRGTPPTNIARAVIVDRGKARDQTRDALLRRSSLTIFPLRVKVQIQRHGKIRNASGTEVRMPETAFNRVRQTSGTLQRDLWTTPDVPLSRRALRHRILRTRVSKGCHKSGALVGERDHHVLVVARRVFTTHRPT